MRETLEGKGQLEKWQNCWPRRRICCGKKLATGSFWKCSWVSLQSPCVSNTRRRSFFNGNFVEFLAVPGDFLRVVCS